MASEGRRLTGNWRVAVRHVATRRFIDVLGWSSLELLMQASEGWANLPATTRPQQRVQPEAARDRVATDSDRQSGRAGTGWTAGWQAYSLRVVPGSISWPPGRWQPPGPSPRPALPCCGLLARSASPVFARGLLTGSPDPALLTTSLSLAGACNDNDRMVLQARSSDRGARPGRLKWTRRRRHSRSREAYARRILTIGLVECVGGTGPRPGDHRPC
jgi:hypothetical protein